MERVHTLKIWPHFLDEIVSGRKRFDVRDARDARDRCFQAGDILQLRAFDPARGEYHVGPPMHVRISAVYANIPGLQPGYVGLSIEPTDGRPL